MSVSVAIAGASGYAGGELLRLLTGHPEFEVKTVTANQNVGLTVEAVHPHLRGAVELQFVETTPEVLSGHDVVFFAMPHGQSGQLSSQVSAGLSVDCGADHRLVSEHDWSRFYGGEYFGAWTYGLPELPIGEGQKQRQAIRNATQIAVPGCNVTAVTLAIAPAINAGLVDSSDVVANLAVGTSGAGRSSKSELSASEILGSARAYSVGGIHRHIPEILQNFQLAGGKNSSISFTPVLVPMSRGILAVVSARVRPNISFQNLRDAWLECYETEAFINVLGDGVVPSTSEVLGSNSANIAVTLDADAGRVIAICAIDNLVKGTAGAAIQSTNIALGFSEQTGLGTVGVAP